MPQAIREIDLHGKNRYQAQISIEAALRRSYGVYVLRLIHGFHRGTSLADFIEATYREDPRVLQLEHPYPGATDLVLRRL